MVKQAQFDTAALSAVKPGLDAALDEVGAKLEQFLAAPDDNLSALMAASAELRRLPGVLKMVHLEGVAVLCAELETVLDELASHPGLLTDLHRDVLRDALFGISHYLEALLHGADNAALRLFPQYQGLQSLRGLEMSFELDLFYPDLAVQLPEKVMNGVPPDDAIGQIKSARSQYQQGLMRFLRQDDVPAALQLMQQAVDAVLGYVPQDDGRAFWWVSRALLDCVMLDGLPPELGARKLFGRIDQQMRAVVDGNATDVQPVLNEMLYLVGRSHAVSEQVDEVKQAYGLDRYLPEVSALPPGEAEQLLGVMRDHLRTAGDVWEKCAKGDKDACASFVEQIDTLAMQSEKLDRNTLQPLTKHIKEMSLKAADPDVARQVGMDMALALLLLDSGIEHYSYLGGAFQEKVRILSERLSAALDQQPENEQQMSDLISLHCQTEQDEAMEPLVNEMLANLQHVEQGLSAFFSDAANRNELPGLERLMAQIHGGLRILSLEQAEQLMVSVLECIHAYVHGNATATPAESVALAGAVSALENYLQHLIHGHQDEDASLQVASADLKKLRHVSVPEKAVPAEQAGVAAEFQRPIGEDQELLEVFLEEAQEVLGIMHDNLEICQLHPDSHEPLVTIRRGFHTLKGSGRMVGLTDLGEVAWCAERAMNKWLQENKPATPGLIHFINQTTQAFSGWVEALNSQGGVQIEAGDLVAMAQQIEDGIEPDISARVKPAEAKAKQVQVSALQPVVEPETVPEPVPEPESAPEPDQVVIGDITLSSSLFGIASTEAKQNALVLNDQFAVMQASRPPVIPYDFMRAAHTLAGVNRTMGFTAVADLAYTLEGWLQARIEKPFALSNRQAQMLVHVIVAIQEMAQDICNQKMPPPRRDLIDQLLADKDRLLEEATPAVVDEAVTQEITPPIPVVPTQEAVPAEPVALPERRAAPTKPQVRDDVDEQLLEIFLEEADDLSPKVSAGLRAWRENPDDTQQADQLKRLLHTIKGSARMAGAMRIGEIAHEMEDRVLAAAQMREQDGYWDGLESDFDRINALLEELRGGEPVVEEVPDGFGRRAEDRGGVERRAERRGEDPSGAERRNEQRALDVGAERALLANMLRVRSDVVDRLVNEASEISVTRSRMEAEIRAFKDGLMELTGSVTRLRKQLREVEIQAESQMQARISLVSDDAEHFDPLEFDRFTRLQELTRFMNESVHDVQTIQLSLLKNIDETDAAMSAQARLNRELQQSLMNVRMVPFSNISERLYRIVRQTGKELNRRANLELIGTGVELDRSVLEKMTAPFEHLLRNAIAHGLEDEQERVRNGKDAIGEIRVKLHQESNEVVFEFSDDGAGLNFAALREKAIAGGLLGVNEEVSEEQLAQLIFTSGISTAEQVTEVAGRGVGMDVVRSEITALGGRIDISSKSGKGTSFIIHLPLTLAVTQVLMVNAGDAMYAIPSIMIEQVRQVKFADMEALYRDRQIEWHGKTYPLGYLPHLLGDAERAPENQPRNSVLLLRSGEQRVALHVDALHGNQEVVVKNVGPQLARLPGIAGATVLGNGAVVLILNPAQLAQRIVTTVRKTVAAAPEVLRVLPLVMVVDDSLTVRKITTRLLTRAGYQVVTAKDGVDALEQLGEITPAVMLLDIEMPRMDGFELAKHLRRDAKTQNLPIIMITSRTADKHRDYAMQLGVNAYLGKPYNEEELLQQIAGFVAVPEMG
ncbi:MAG: Hpt domain-containing protein [Nitrosomonadales bacterium]|nr:Hpt domain-containing protein [Nitrosomonadales bacterium]